MRTVSSEQSLKKKKKKNHLDTLIFFMIDYSSALSGKEDEQKAVSALNSFSALASGGNPM
jgi:hypothetical protein